MTLAQASFRIFALLAVVTLAAGCASTFTKPGATESDLDRDETECEVKASQAKAGGLRRQGFMDRCMRGQGWAAK